MRGVWKVSIATWAVERMGAAAADAGMRTLRVYLSRDWFKVLVDEAKTTAGYTVNENHGPESWTSVVFRVGSVLVTVETDQ
jgi:hypothetical protein